MLRFKHLVDLCVPAAALSDIGHVHWRIHGGPEMTANVVTLSGQISVSHQLLNTWDTWYGPRNIWKRWPSYDELIFRDLTAMYEVYAAKLTDQLRDTSSLGLESAVLSVVWQAQPVADHQADR